MNEKEWKKGKNMLEQERARKGKKGSKRMRMNKIERERMEKERNTDKA